MVPNGGHLWALCVAVQLLRAAGGGGGHVTTNLNQGGAGLRACRVEAWKAVMRNELQFTEDIKGMKYPPVASVCKSHQSPWPTADTALFPDRSQSRNLCPFSVFSNMAALVFRLHLKMHLLEPGFKQTALAFVDSRPAPHLLVPVMISTVNSSQCSEINTGFTPWFGALPFPRRWWGTQSKRRARKPHSSRCEQVCSGDGDLPEHHSCCSLLRPPAPTSPLC